MGISENKITSFIKDITGLRAGKLVAVKPDHKSEDGKWKWLCRCDCGNTVVRYGYLITKAHNKGQPSNCGCEHHLKTHGLREKNKRLYWVWAAMIQRCENPSSKDWDRYGGRGITVCEEWRAYPSFYEWAINSGYKQGLTIERIDVNQGYRPENCTWIPNARQALNWEHSHILTFRGETKHLSDWCAELGISKKTLYGRIHHYGWSVERALTEPVRERKK